MTAEGEEEGEKKTTAKMWTTWEELLVACAVKRHGLKDWDTVAMEIQTRTTPALANLYTTQICRNKYYELKRRFSGETPAAADDDDVTVPWVEELRKLRMAELRKDVQRYDLSIQSLQLKVKILEEEREHSRKESEEKNDARPDLERSESDKIDADGLPAAVSPANTAGKEVSGEHSNRSFNESNSSENREKFVGERDSESKPVQTTASAGGSVKPDPESKSVRADSCNDSSDTVAKHLATKTSHAKKKESDELRDSEEASESKEETKDSSDVQSSASLTKKKRRKPGEVSRGGGGGGSKEEPVVASPATTATKTKVVVKSEPLVAVMDIIRSHKHGSMFERRLESQKTDKYNKIVRQHVDLRIVQTRIDDDSYSSCGSKFFLDLLLIFNNAIVYFPKQSSESIAAQDLRALVLKEMRKKRDRKKPDPPSKAEPAPLTAKPEPERSDSLLAKHKSTAPIVVCRKRSSISSKPSSSNKAVEKEKEKEPVVAAKPLVIPKIPVKTSSNEDDDPLRLNIKEKPVTGARSMRRSGNSSRSNSASNVAPSKNHVTSSSSNPGNSTSKGSDGHGQGSAGPVKVDKKKPAAEVAPPAVKKRGAADFLKRIKKNSPAKGTAVEEDGGSSRKEPVKKRVEERKEGMTERQKSSGGSGGGGGGNRGGRQVKEDVSPSKRGVGRPPKKGKEVVPAKRGRETVEPESAKRPAKRSRR